MVAISCQVYPIFLASDSTSRSQVFLGHPRFLFPWGHAGRISFTFLACFCTSQRVQRLRDELTLAQTLPNGWTDWHQIWHTMSCADSSGNGYTPNKLTLETQGWHLGGFRGSQIQNSEEAVKLAPTLVHVWDSSGNGHRLNTSRPSITQEAFRGGGGGGRGVRGSQIQKSGSCQIGMNFGSRLRIHLGMDIG